MANTGCAFVSVVLLALSSTASLGAEQATDAEVLEAVAPVYPRLARFANVTGAEVVHVEIGEDGRVKKASFVSGHPLLTEASLEAAQYWVFRPASGVRGVDLTFSFEICPSESVRGRMSAIFKPPFAVEIRELPAPAMID